MKGLAVDLDIKRRSDSEVETMIRSAVENGAKRIGLYTGRTGLHVDMGSTGVGKKKAHFMYDRSIRNLGRAPKWFRDLAAEYGN
jgi:GH25 family lysozyme M1 (1,4-beta-N-acetylmuramidase)